MHARRSKAERRPAAARKHGGAYVYIRCRASNHGNCNGGQGRRGAPQGARKIRTQAACLAGSHTRRARMRMSDARAHGPHAGAVQTKYKTRSFACMHGRDAHCSTVHAQPVSAPSCTARLSRHSHASRCASATAITNTTLDGASTHTGNACCCLRAEQKEAMLGRSRGRAPTRKRQ